MWSDWAILEGSRWQFFWQTWPRSLAIFSPFWKHQIKVTTAPNYFWATIRLIVLHFIPTSGHTEWQGALSLDVNALLSLSPFLIVGRVERVRESVFAVAERWMVDGVPTRPPPMTTTTTTLRESCCKSCFRHHRNLSPELFVKHFLV